MKNIFLEYLEFTSKYTKSFLINLLYIKLIFRRIILVSLDTFLIFISLYLVDFYLASSSSYTNYSLPLLIICIPIYLFTGQYSSLTRYISIKTFHNIILRNFSILLIIYFLNFSPRNFNNISLNKILLIWTILNLLMISSRVYLKYFIIFLKKADKKSIVNVAIYGAGKSGAQLASSISLDNKYSIKFFIDDNPELWGRKLFGRSIYSMEKTLHYKNEINTILIAITQISRSKKLEIFNYLKNNSIEFLQIPSLEKLRKGESRIDELKPILIEDILPRDEIAIDKNAILKKINDKVICVTGAGGSIGSELCKQIADLNPKKLLLIELSEINLYEIKNKLLNIKPDLNIQAFLANACNKTFLREIFNKNKVNIVFHAAAYKHVSIVEENPIAGIYNNIFSTKSICEIGYSTNVESIIFISTDKAVRPSNLMGATKRLAELIVQSYAEKTKKSKLRNYKKFSIVRFGNVLGSSGSVVPLFKKQIELGGPITVTHPKVVRYFMSITEAVNLVLQTLNMAKGGEVFLLDMGKPVKIFDLATQMIELSGLKVKDEQNLDGDIEISFTGLKAGEKLYEELLIRNKSEKTNHPLIFMAKEEGINEKRMINSLNNLKENLKENNVKESIEIVSKLVPEWNKSSIFINDKIKDNL